MTKIVLLSAFVSPLRSGAEACAEEVAARLKDRFDITIVAARMRPDLPIDDWLKLDPSTSSGQAGVKVKRVGFGSPIDKWLYPFLAPAAAAALQPDIIHAVLESFAGMALVFSKNTVPTAKRILTCQSTNTALLLRPMHRAAHRVTAISSVLVERAKSFGVAATLIPNGIRLKELQAAKVERVAGRILFAGRLEPMKGVDDLIEAFGYVREKHPSATLRIVGDGSERPRLEALAKGIPGIEFVGKVAHDQIAREYASANIFCGLSRSEAFGNVFVEAQAAGCAVVATNTGGIPDIVHDGETGVLVPVDDPVAASEALSLLLANPGMRARLTEAGRANAAAYDWDDIAERYGALYSEIL